MIEILKAAILGIVQGATEFLPVSSSGHLALLGKYLGYTDGTLMAVMMHGGTLLALIVFFRKELACIILSPFKKDSKNINLLLYLFIGSIPAGIVGILVMPYIEKVFDSTIVVGLCLVATGIILFLSGFAKGDKREMGFLTALFIGISQAFAILPGISRSGATISMGVYMGLDRRASANFSFLLAIPAILGAFIVEVGTVERDLINLPLILGTITSFVTSIFAIKFLLGFLRRRTLRPFSYYCFFVGLLVILLSIFSGII